MRQLIVFNHVSLDGYFVDSTGSMIWAKSDSHDAEWSAFVSENARGNGTLVFGRVTYQMMASYWPTPMADQQSPELARRMNSLQKVVFSRTLDQASWQNTKLIKGDLTAEVRKMKEEAGDGLVILGSGTLVSQLAQEGLIDEFQVVVNPIVLGKGRTLFEGVKENLRLKLRQSRTFRNGDVFLCYQPVA